MTRIQVKKNVAYILDKDIFTRGQVGATVRFEFSNDWSNYVKVAVFVSGEIYKNVIITEPGNINTVTVPWEVLQVSGATLQVGVYGSNSLGTKLVPTIWCDLGVVRDSSDPTVDIDASPTFIQQVMKMVNQTMQYRDQAALIQAEMNGTTASVEMLPAGSQPEVIISHPNDVLNLDFRIPVGDKGTSVTSITSEQAEGYTILTFNMSDGMSPQIINVPNGTDGVSIQSVELVEGDHSPGTTDIYRVNLSNGEVAGEFTVYNGEDSKVIKVNNKEPDASGNINLELSDFGVTVSADDINALSGASGVDFSNLSGIEASADEINALHGSGITEDKMINLANINTSYNQINELNGSDVTKADFVKLRQMTPSLSELNVLHYANITNRDLQKLGEIEASASDINKLDGLLTSKEELESLQGIEGNVQSILDSKADISVNGHVLEITINSDPDDPDAKLHYVQPVKSVNSTNSIQYINPDYGYDAIAKVVINSLSDVDPNLTPDNIRSGASVFGVAGTYEGGDDPIDPELITIEPSKEANPSNEIQIITADEPYTSIAKIILHSVLDVEPNIIPENIRVGVSIFGVQGTFGNKEKEEVKIQSTVLVNPRNYDQEIYPDSKFGAIRQVVVNSLSETDTNFIPYNIKAGVAILGITGTYTGSDDPFVPTGVTTEISKVVNPSDKDQIIYADTGYAAMSSITINSVTNAEPNLIPENIKQGVSIFGVTGTYTGE